MVLKVTIWVLGVICLLLKLLLLVWSLYLGLFSEQSFLCLNKLQHEFLLIQSTQDYRVYLTASILHICLLCLMLKISVLKEINIIIHLLYPMIYTQWTHKIQTLPQAMWLRFFSQFLLYSGYVSPDIHGKSCCVSESLKIVLFCYKLNT